MAESGENQEKRDYNDSVSGKMSGDENIICQPCKEDGLKLPAVKFCTDCADHLCKTCVECHQRAKPLRSHVLVPSSNIPERNILCKRKKKEICKLHEGKEITSFCNQHQQLCCSTCIATGHSICVGLDKLKEYDKNVDKWGELKAFTDKLHSLNCKYAARKKTTRETAERMNISAADAILRWNELKSKDEENVQTIEQTCDTVLLEIRSFQDALTEAQKAQDKTQVFTLLKTFSKRVDFMDKNSANIESAIQFGRYRIMKQPTKALPIGNINIGATVNITRMCLLSCDTLAVKDNGNMIFITKIGADPKYIEKRAFIDMKASYKGKMFALHGSRKSICMYPMPIEHPHMFISFPLPSTATSVQCYKEVIIVQFRHSGDIVEMSYSGNIRKTLANRRHIGQCFTFDEETGSLFASDNGLKEFTKNGSVRVLVKTGDICNISDMVYDAGEFFVVGNKSKKELPDHRRNVYHIAMNGDSDMIISERNLGFNPLRLAFDNQYRLLYVGGQKSDTICIFCV